MPRHVPRETPSWTKWPWKRILIAAIRDLGLEISEDNVETLLAYFQHLLFWNRKINLIGPGTPPVQLVKHVVDSLTGLLILPRGPYRLVDIGSGAGLPGMVLKIARPEWEAGLLEPREKKSAFLRHVVRTLSLARMDIISSRLEDPAVGPPISTANLVTFRGLGAIDQVLPRLAGYLTPGTFILLYKGPRGAEEMQDWLQHAQSPRFSLVKELNLTLPLLGDQRSLILLECRFF